MNTNTMNRNTEKRPPACLDGMSENVAIAPTPDYTDLVNDVTQSLGDLAEHLKTLKGRLGPILMCNPYCDPTTEGTEGIPGQSRFRTDMAAILLAIRLITDEVQCITREVDL